MSTCGVVLALGSERSGSELRARPGAANLLTVANRPVTHHAVDLLRQAGIDGQIAVISTTGTDPALRRGLDALGDPELTYIEVPVGSGSVDALLTVRSRFATGPLVVVTGAGLVLEGLAEAITRFSEEQLDLVLLATRDRVEVAASDGIARHPAARRPVPLGVELLSQFALGVAAAPELSADPGATLEDLAHAVREAGGRTAVDDLASGWSHTGDDDSVLVANALLLERLVAGAGRRQALPAYALVDPTAVIERTTIRGPAIIGRGARVIDSYIGPYTSVGADTHIEGSEIENSVVLSRARISFVGSRILGSLIGSSARVSQTFSRPSGLRVHLGADLSLTL